MSGAVPQMRFPGFAGKWEKIPAGEIFEFRNGLNYLKDAVGDEVKVIGVGDFQSNESISDYSELNVVAVDNAAKDSILLRNGDILFVRSNGNKDLIGRTMLVKKLSERVAYSGFTIRGRITDDGLSPDFAAKSFRANRFRTYLREMGGGTNISNLSQDIVSGYSLFIPSLTEQQKIADFLGKVDAKLDALRRKKSGLEAFKSGLMQRLFSQELRFTRDDGTDFSEWEEMRLDEVAEIRKGKQVNRDTLSECGDYAVINGGTTPSGFHTDFNTAGETITISEGGNSCGYVAWQKRPFWCGGHCYAVTPMHKGIERAYLFQALKLAEPDIMRLRVGSGLPNIQKGDLSAVSLFVPHPNEQRKIADALSAMDAKISAVADQITHMETFKKGLLQQMFV